jgi:hypothetical protein
MDDDEAVVGEDGVARWVAEVNETIGMGRDPG